MRLLLVLLIFYFSSFYANAEELTIQQVRDIAHQYLISENLTIPVVNDVYCIVCNDDSVGYVIIDRRTDCKRRIIGLSFESKWDECKMPPVLQKWLHDMVSNNSQVRTCTDTFPHLQSAKKDIIPLLKSHWHQGSPYNDLAPVITDGNVKTVAGCVAIAAAQITYYWRRDNPLYTLKNTPTYIYGGAPVSISIPKGSPNNWELILDEYSDDASQESRDAVAQLCYVIGTTSYLNYASSTGGSIRDAANAMFSQFNLLSEYISKNKVSYYDWIDILYNEIEKGYPVMCSGVGNGGHAFVLDGYDSDTGLFHFNFGWGGAGDGYYPVDDSADSMGGYSTGQTIVYNIHPSSRNIEASLKCTNEKYDDSMINVNIMIKNKSTLPIRQLHIYAISDNSTVEEADSAIWIGPEINNDGIEYSVSTSLSKYDGCKTVLYLTDEQKYELAHYTLDNKNVINNIINDKPTIHSYNLLGQKIKNLQSGFYIVDYGTHKEKRIKRYE